MKEGHKVLNIRSKLENRTRDFIRDQVITEYAVLLPLVKKQGELYLLFELRSQNLRGQPGEICFPGGSTEHEDMDPSDTAVRETCEELRIKRADIEVLGPLDILLTAYQVKIFPYVGSIAENVAINPDPREVEEVFYIPLDYFLTTKPFITQVKVNMQPEPDFPFQLIPNGKEYDWKQGRYPVYFYNYGNYSIWGITARILYNFIEIISKK